MPTIKKDGLTYQLPYETRGTTDSSKEKAACLAQGGTWDETTKSCILPQARPNQNIPPAGSTNGSVPPLLQNGSIPLPPNAITPPSSGENQVEAPKNAPPTQPELIRDEKGNVTGLNLPNGQTYLGLDEATINAILGNYNQTPEQAVAQGLAPAGTARRQAEFAAQGAQLAGQVGQFGQLGVNPTGLDVGQAATQGVIGAIPKALSFAATGAIAGAAGGSVFAGVGAVPGGAIGATAGFVSGISSGILSNFKSQRTDTTKAQKQVLMEGKQNLNDWAVLAASDPANRAQYVANFNAQLALIDQAYRQMKLDTSRDVAKFETALPDLAEFEAFYSSQGERDYLTSKMLTSLQAPQDPEAIYQMQELNHRYNPPKA